MNNHAQWRLNFARRLAEKICQVPGVLAIMVGGSVARGWADEYSDLELPIFWETLPDDSVRLALVQALGAEFLHSYNGPALEDQLLLDGFQFDLWHNTVAGEEATFKGVLEEHSTDLGDSNFMDTVRACIPLHGAEIIQGWKNRASDYPPGLAVAFIKERMPNFNTGQLHLAGQRNNPTEFYYYLCRLQQEAFLVLLALNRHYFPTYKWMYRVIEDLQVKPAHAGDRLRSLFGMPYGEAANGMQRFLIEMLDLVDQQHLPVSTEAVRRRLAYQRLPRWNEPSGLP